MRRRKAERGGTCCSCCHPESGVSPTRDLTSAARSIDSYNSHLRKSDRVHTIEVVGTMRKHVISVGFEIPGDVNECVEFTSDNSLLDADIVVFAPNLKDYRVHETYKGKSCLAEHDSGRIQTDSAHWNREIRIALSAGKTVFVVLLGVEAVYVHTGQTNYSGTGRNARATNIVDLFDPYSSIPISGLGSGLQRRVGERFKTTNEIGPLASYWQEFGEASYYQAYLDRPIGVPALVTQTGDKMVGGVVSFKDMPGKVVFLPFPSLKYLAQSREPDDSEIATRPVSPQDSQGDDADEPTEAERSVGNQFINALVGIDRALRDAAEKTPPPLWATAAEYDTNEEAGLRAEAHELESRIAELQKQKLATETALEGAGNLRGLLFEKGRPLESAILEALRIIGFRAEGLVDEESEFDAVFADSSARLIGEAEGKDDKAINIDKLDQLERNIQEDYAKRPESTDYAKGVLFGNASRLSPPCERGDFFTKKCVSGAKRLSIALVRTPDLFVIAKFLKENPDPKFAAECREAIIKTSGEIVLFPAVGESFQSESQQPSANQQTAAAE
jgi:hypothetical protein